MEFIFDLKASNEIANTRMGMEVVRPVYVKSVPIANGASDPGFLLKIIADPQCPQIDDEHPSHSELLLDEQRLRSVDQNKTSAWLDLIYRSPPWSPGAGGGAIAYVVEQTSQQYTVTTMATADGGAALTVWYKKGEPASTTVFPTDPPMADLKDAGMPIVKTYDVLRAVGAATRAQWNAVKSTIRGARGRIHSDAWGSAARGQYLFLGPSIRYTTPGNLVNIQLDFLGDENGHFPMGAYFDQNGNHPADSATESDLRTGGPPAVNTYKGVNGLVLASVYPETTFSDKFSFTPDN